MTALGGVWTAAVALMLAAGPATEPELELAPGTETHTRVPAVTVFDADRRWVPGDTDTARLAVRNAGPDDATVWLALESLPDSTLLASRAVSIEARLADEPWVVLPPGGHPVPLSQRRVSPGSRVPVTFRASFRADADNSTQRAGAELRFVVGMTGIGAAAERTGDLSLPAAGAVISPWLIVAGATAVAAGLSMRRREERREP